MKSIFSFDGLDMDGRIIGNGEYGIMTRQLSAYYKESIQEEILKYKGNA